MSRKEQKRSSYSECRRNHACKLGGYAVDGCRKYIASDPTSLVCVACGCHRNFHRRYDGNGINDAEKESTWSEDMQLSLGIGGGPKKIMEKKRNKKTVFSKDQREGMKELAEKVGWRLRRGEEGVVVDACKKIGVERDVFKVWMHNNKRYVLAAKSKIATDKPAADVPAHRGGNDNDNGGGSTK